MRRLITVLIAVVLAVSAHANSAQANEGGQEEHRDQKVLVAPTPTGADVGAAERTAVTTPTGINPPPSRTLTPEELERAQTRLGGCVLGATASTQIVATAAGPATCYGTPGQAQPDPVTVAVMARARLQLPTPAIRAWPPTDREVAGVRGWLHLDTWAPLAATATAGTVSATVTATPRAATWHLGETDLTCSSAGTVWDPAHPGATSDCSYVFQRWTNGATITATVDVAYDLRWAATTGDGGDLGTITATGTFPLRVWEIQAQIN